MGDELDVDVRNDFIVLSPKRRRAIRPKDINALFAGYEGDFKAVEDGFNTPADKESL